MMENGNRDRTALLIDVDGTLVDSTYLHAAAWSAALRAAGIDIPTSRTHRLIGMRGERLLSELLGAGRAEQLAEQVQAEHDRRFAAVRDQAAPLPGARRLLQALAAEGVVAVLTSSAKSAEIEHYLGLLDARELVHGYTSSGDVSRSKPDPEPVQVAMRQSGCGRAVVVGDSPWDCLAAEGAGLACVAVLTGGFAATELEQAGAALVCEDTGEVCDRLPEVLGFAAPAARASSAASGERSM
jgi:HAD superfamily hydrolase (TIGR01509 family)